MFKKGKTLRKIESALSQSFIALEFLGLVLGTHSEATATTIVVLNGLATTEGNTNNRLPFHLKTFSVRYQQVYAASEFTALAGPEFITEIAFRPKSFTEPTYAVTLSNIQINLSTTANGPDALSLTFANNVGPDDTTVHSGTLPLSSSITGPVGGPNAFDIVISLTAPFLYDPSAGNLLLDVRNFSGPGPFPSMFFDAHFASDGISRVFASGSGEGGSPLQADSLGLVTKFTFQPTFQPMAPVIPEPSTMLLLGSGLAGLVAWRLRKAKA